MSKNSNKKLRVCTNHRANLNHPSCSARGSNAILTSLVDQDLGVEVEESPCMGLCNVGPNVRLVPDGICFNAVSREKLDDVVAEIKSLIAY